MQRGVLTGQPAVQLLSQHAPAGWCAASGGSTCLLCLNKGRQITGANHFLCSCGSPLLMQALQDGQSLHGNAGHHFLWHALALRVPHIPQAGAQHVHDLHAPGSGSSRLCATDGQLQAAIVLATDKAGLEQLHRAKHSAHMVSSRGL